MSSDDKDADLSALSRKVDLQADKQNDVSSICDERSKRIDQMSKGNEPPLTASEDIEVQEKARVSSPKEVQRYEPTTPTSTHSSPEASIERPRLSKQCVVEDYPAPATPHLSVVIEGNGDSEKVKSPEVVPVEMGDVNHKERDEDCDQEHEQGDSQAQEQEKGKPLREGAFPNRGKQLVRSHAMCGDDDTRLRPPQDNGATARPQLSSKSISRDSTCTVATDYTDSSGVDLNSFIVVTLHKNPKDRQMILDLESQLIGFVEDHSKQSMKFGPLSSYNRMLIHRVAAYFGLDHNVDQTGLCVVVSKIEGTRVPDFSFSSLIQGNFYTDTRFVNAAPTSRYFSCRDAQSYDEPRGGFTPLAANRGGFRKTRSFDVNTGMMGRGYTDVVPMAGTCAPPLGLGLAPLSPDGSIAPAVVPIQMTPVAAYPPQYALSPTREAYGQQIGMIVSPRSLDESSGGYGGGAEVVPTQWSTGRNFVQKAGSFGGVPQYYSEGFVPAGNVTEQQTASGEEELVRSSEEVNNSNANTPNNGRSPRTRRPPSGRYPRTASGTSAKYSEQRGRGQPPGQAGQYLPAQSPQYSDGAFTSNINHLAQELAAHMQMNASNGGSSSSYSNVQSPAARRVFYDQQGVPYSPGQPVNYSQMPGYVAESGYANQAMISAPYTTAQYCSSCPVSSYAGPGAEQQQYAAYSEMQQQPYYQRYPVQMSSPQVYAAPGPTGGVYYYTAPGPGAYVDNNQQQMYYPNQQQYIPQQQSGQIYVTPDGYAYGPQGEPIDPGVLMQLQQQYAAAAQQLQQQQQQIEAMQAAQSYSQQQAPSTPPAPTPVTEQTCVNNRPHPSLSRDAGYSSMTQSIKESDSIDRPEPTSTV